MRIAATLGIVLLLAQAPPQRGATQGPLPRAAQPTADIGEQSRARAAAGPPEVVSAEKAWAGADVLMPLAVSADSRIQMAALRAVGRLEDPRVVPQLMAIGNSPKAPIDSVASAIAQSLKGFDPARDPALIANVSTWLGRNCFIGTGIRRVGLPGPIGSIAYNNAGEVHAAEDCLRRILDDSAYDDLKAGIYQGAARGLESLARLNPKETFEEETVKWLDQIAVRTLPNDNIDGVRENALAALISARALDSDTEKQVLKDTDPQVRRLAMAVLGGAGAGLGDDERIDLIVRGLRDQSAQVRYEALRGYIRRGAPARGCGAITNMLSDQDPHVVVAALDALGDLCKEDEAVTTRLLAEARTPSVSAWHRETHAFLALAKRAPEMAVIPMGAFVTHPSWWVRMYTVQAAVATGDVARLEKLAYDVNDNVRDAALAPLRRLKKADAEPAIVAALDRTDVQLLRTTALLLKESPVNAKLFQPLLLALTRLTKEGKETSRDARIPLLEAIAVHARPEDARELVPLLKDFDPVIAGKAAEVITALTGKPAAAEPKPLLRGWPQAVTDLRQCVTVSLSSGPSFQMMMNPTAAPITVDRFLKLVSVDRYYDGLSIHRVVPNFVIQGGGPGDNEYSGHQTYMRDEIGASNTRGAVGLSTRGRNTADAQFFINLVDNPRLDGDYTVFARVPAADMPVVERIQEGDVMRLSMLKCAK
jgi:cyclophilin family peptidyl-prolyl cis-trans isomerase/HEAT repeat protein